MLVKLFDVYRLHGQWHHVVCPNTLPGHSWIKLCVNIQVCWSWELLNMFRGNQILFPFSDKDKRTDSCPPPPPHQFFYLCRTKGRELIRNDPDRSKLSSFEAFQSRPVFPVLHSASEADGCSAESRATSRRTSRRRRRPSLKWN